MDLRELAEDSLLDSGDFEIRAWERSGPVVNDIRYTDEDAYLKVEYFRLSEKARFLLKIDGHELPFATVTRIRKRVLPDSYQARAEILPCMIPMALEALASYMLTHPVMSGDTFSEHDAMPHVLRTRAVQQCLTDLLKDALLTKKSP